MRKIRYAYIFDFDGVLVRTMEAHFQCYKQALREAGVPIVRKQFFHQAGMTGLEQIRYFVERAGVKANIEEIYRRKREIWEKSPRTVTDIDCNVEFLRILRAAHVPVAIASGSSRRTILPIMKQHGIEADTVVGADDVRRGKPHPDLFLCAARRLGIPPKHCIVVEDSDVGIEAARAANMKAIRFYDNEGD